MNNTKNNINRSFLKDLLIGIGVTAAFILTAELGLRAFWKIKWPQDPRYWQFNEKAGFKYVPGTYSPEKSIVGFGGNVNSLGYRGPEWKKEKDPGTCRIVCLGDSVVLGLWGKAEDASFPRQLEILLNKSSRKKKYEILNGGLGNNTSTQTLFRLKNEFLDYHPDLAIVEVGFNDMNESNPTLPASYQSNGWIREIARQSYLIRTAAGYTFKVLIPKMKLSPRQVEDQTKRFEAYIPEPFKTNLSEIAQVCKEKNIKLVFLTLSLRNHTIDMKEHPELLDPPPYFARDPKLFRILLDRYNGVIRETGKTMNVPVIDMSGFWERVPQGSKYFQDFAHFTDEGYALYARELLRRIERVIDL